MSKLFKKNLVIFGVIFVMIGLVGCSQMGSDGGTPSGDLVLEDLQAVSGTELEATFSNGETKTITDFTPKPLEVNDKKTKVSFVYEGTSYSEKINYVITISGSLSDTSQKIMAADSGSFTVDDIAKIVLFFGKEYKTAEVTNGTFTITIDEKSPGGIAFLDADNNYMGYLSLANGLDSIPTQAISDETGEIDLGKISFTSDGIGEPSQNPFEKMDTSKKSVLEAAGSFFGALVRSPGYIEQMVKGDLKIDFGLMYFTDGGTINKNGKGSLNDGNQIGAHRFNVGFEPEYDNFKNLKVDYPIDDNGNDVLLEVTPEKINDGESSPEGVSFAGVGPDERFTGAAIPPAGKYQIYSGNDFDFTITMPDIKDDAQNNLVFPVPKFNINTEGIVESIEWEYRNKNDYVVDKPAEIVDNLEIQLEAKVKDNDQLKGNYDWTSHGRIADIKLRDISKTKYEFTDKTIYWEDVGGLNMAYDDIFGVHYVTSPNIVKGSYSLTTNVEGAGSISNIEPDKDIYSLGENVNLVAKPDNYETNNFGYWKFNNRDDIKTDSDIWINMINDTDITAVFGKNVFADYFDRSNLSDTDDWYLFNKSKDLEEMSIENGELEMRIVDTDTNDNEESVYIKSLAVPSLNQSVTELPDSYLIKGDFKLVSEEGAYGIYLGMQTPDSNDNFYFYTLQINEAADNFNLISSEPQDSLASGDISNIVKKGEFNNITVKRINDQYSFYLNGELLTTQELDSSIIEMIAAENFSWEGVNLPATIRVDNVELLDLPQ